MLSKIFYKNVYDCSSVIYLMLIHVRINEVCYKFIQLMIVTTTLELNIFRT